MKYNEINQNEVSTTYVPFGDANAGQIKNFRNNSLATNHKWVPIEREET